MGAAWLGPSLCAGRGRTGSSTANRVKGANGYGVNREAALLSKFRRVLWHVNRSPAAHVIKWVMRLMVSRSIEVRRQLARSLPSHSEINAAADMLAKNGYVLLDQVIDREAMQALARAGEAKMARHDLAASKQASTHKTFWTRLLDEDMEQGMLPTDNPFVSFALQPAVLGILSRALGELPQLDYVLLTLSHGDSRELTYSQLWHRDHDDVRTIKLFVYLTDVVSEAHGPFTFLPAHISDRFGFSIRSHRGDAEILPRVKLGEVVSMIAPRLTTFMVETSRCLHMGSRMAPGHERLLYTATFITVPRLYPEPPPRFRLNGDEDEVVRSVLSPKVFP